jgi:hypothetical protein
VVNEAEPDESVTVLNTVGPSRNCTVPVAVAGVIAALKVTDWPEVDGFRLEVSAIDVLFLTVRDRTGETAAELEASPPYCAVSEYVPGANPETLNVAAPPLRVALPNAAAPL